MPPSPTRPQLDVHPPAADALGVLTSTAPLVALGTPPEAAAGDTASRGGAAGNAASVAEDTAQDTAARPHWAWLDAEQVRRVASQHAKAAPPAPAEESLHATFLPPEQFCNYLLALEALNFCFWDAPPRWQVRHDGVWHNGYWALTAALLRAIREDHLPLWEAQFLAELDLATLQRLLRGKGSPPPLMAKRLEHLREVGQVLLQHWGGQFAALIEAAGGDAISLVRAIVQSFPSFRDEVSWRGQTVVFYKRAQICVADLARLLPSHPLGQVRGLERLTAFADYKVPQVLRQLGILRLAPPLAAQLEREEPLVAGSEPELAIRSCTIWGCEWLARALAHERRQPVTPTEVDYLLWCAGQNAPDLPPYHRTRTIYY